MNFKPMLREIKAYILEGKGICGKIIKSLVILPFALCVLFLKMAGRALHLSYEQISVVVNLYFQGGVLLLSGVAPFVVQCERMSGHWTLTNFVITLLLLSYAAIYMVGMMALLQRYPLPLNDSFGRCVNDLLKLAEKCHVSYMALNLIIFVGWWLTLIGTNLLLCLKLAEKV